VEFDSSLKKGKPVEIKPAEVVRGWSEALLLMHEGDKWELTIPAGMRRPHNARIALAVGRRAP
jgi:FKBP-type peptidyl-prolyl cis-trans isomerase